MKVVSKSRRQIEEEARSESFTPAETEWHADRLSLLVDNQAFFRTAKEALEEARHSVLLLGWEFDPRTLLDPGNEHPTTIGDLLNDLVRARPELDVRVLIWNANPAVSASVGFFPHRARAFLDKRIHFRLDDAHPLGSCHHQKLLVIDDAVAFCSGDDFLPARWDLPSHPDRHPGRARRGGADPHHGLTALVDGEAAQALGRLARERWRRATGQRLQASRPASDAGDPWPRSIPPELRNLKIQIVRTAPAGPREPAIREGERWFLDAIRTARRWIYIENQYATSPLIATALAKRLAEPDGPEILMVLAPRAPSYFDRLIMDAARDAFVTALDKADRFGRFRAYGPYSPGGRAIMVHSKLMIVDGESFRIGSANLNNRSMGFDTECDLAFSAVDGERGDAVRRWLMQLVHRLLAHFLGCPSRILAAAHEREDSLIAAVEALDAREYRRLRPMFPDGSGTFGALTATHHLGDPESTSDSFRPWRRRSGPARLPRGAILAAIIAVAIAGRWVSSRRSTLCSPKGTGHRPSKQLST